MPKKESSANVCRNLDSVFQCVVSRVQMPPNVGAHRPPIPDFSKLQNSKAPVPSANGGSVQRSGSATCSAYSKNLRPNLSRLVVRPGRATVPGTITANHAKYTKTNPCPTATEL